MKYKKPIQTERYIQISLFEWAKHIKIDNCSHLFDFMTASANGGSRNLLEAINLKKTGVSAGFPDISILLPRYNYHGMFLEVKRDKKFSVSEHQKKWIDRLNNVGYYAVIGNGFEKCKLLIEGYIKGEVLSHTGL